MKLLNTLKNLIKMKALFILLFMAAISGACNKESDNLNSNPSIYTDTFETESFTFLSNGDSTKGKIYLPTTYNSTIDLPTIFLIDFTEQHFAIALDEFEKVIAGVEQIEDFDALIVTLEEHLTIDATPEDFQDYYEIFNNMTSYVDDSYTNNTSRTFIARGSEAGIVMMTLFLEDSASSVFDNFIVTDPAPSFMDAVISMIENDDFPQNKADKKLHFSFSISNDQEKCIELISLINNAQYPWLQFESIEYNDSDYENTYPLAFAAGLTYIFVE